MIEITDWLYILSFYYFIQGTYLRILQYLELQYTRFCLLIVLENCCDSVCIILIEGRDGGGVGRNVVAVSSVYLVRSGMGSE